MCEFPSVLSHAALSAWTELSGERKDLYQDAPPPSLHGPLQPQKRPGLEPPVSPGGPVRSCFLPHLAGGPVLGSTRPRGRGGGVVCGETPLAFTDPSGGWVPLEAKQRALFLPGRSPKPVWLLAQGGGNVGEAGRGRRPPCKPCSYKMHFPTYPSGLSEPLLLTALFIHDRQLINIQTS